MVGGQRPGERQLGVGGGDERGPPVGLFGGAQRGDGPAEGGFGEPDGVLVMQISSLRAQCGSVDNAARRTSALVTVVTALELFA